MTEPTERETPTQPAPIRDDGWWHTIIEAVLDEFEVPEKERYLGPGL